MKKGLMFMTYVAAAISCAAVDIQELIWRIRMEYRPDQTNRFLQTIK